MLSNQTETILRSYQKLTPAEQETYKKEFSEDTKNLYDYLLALGWLPLLFLIAPVLRKVWYIWVILTIAAFVFLQLFYFRKFALHLLKEKNMRGFMEFLIKAELVGAPEPIDADKPKPTIEDSFIRSSTPEKQPPVEEKPVEEEPTVL